MKDVSGFSFWVWRWEANVDSREERNGATTPPIFRMEHARKNCSCLDDESRWTPILIDGWQKQKVLSLKNGGIARRTLEETIHWWLNVLLPLDHIVHGGNKKGSRGYEWRFTENHTGIIGGRLQEVIWFVHKTIFTQTLFQPCLLNDTDLREGNHLCR